MRILKLLIDVRFWTFILISLFIAVITRSIIVHWNDRPVEIVRDYTTGTSYFIFPEQTDFEENTETEEVVPVAKTNYVKTLNITHLTSSAPSAIEEIEIEYPDPVYDYTQEELIVLANLLERESGAEPRSVKEKNASVVLNRILDEGKDFPNDLIGVVYQTKPGIQFTPSVTHDLTTIDTPSDECFEVAEHILTNGSILPPDVMVFYNENDKGWVLTRTVYEKDSKTIFAYLRW